MSPSNILITGCNRGIGLELVKQYLKATPAPANLFATCRDPSKAEELSALAKDNANLHILKLDVTDHAAFDAIAAKVEEKTKKDGLNLLINNAGLIPKDDRNGPTPEAMREAFETNCIAPLFFSRAMLPLVRTASKKTWPGTMSSDRAAIVMMSTAVASVEENTGGGIYAYRSSKSALNMSMKSLSVELKADEILVMSMHPGWVQTDMGGPNALITTDTCVTAMLETIKGLGDKDHGKFLRYNNTPIPW